MCVYIYICMYSAIYYCVLLYSRFYCIMIYDVLFYYIGGPGPGGTTRLTPLA